MKNLLLALTLFSGLLYGQNYKCYLPTGKPCEKMELTIRNLCNKYESKGRCWTAHNGNSVIGFKSLSTTPLFIVTDKNITTADINSEIANSDKSFYFGKYYNGLKMDIKKLVSKNILTDLFLIENLGGADNVVKTTSNNIEISKYTYDKYGIDIYFKDGIAYRIDEF